MDIGAVLDSGLREIVLDSVKKLLMSLQLAIGRVCKELDSAINLGTEEQCLGLSLCQ